MKMTSPISIVLFLALRLIAVRGFTSVRPSRLQSARPGSSSKIQNGSVSALKATEQLVFSGDYCGISEPLPAEVTKEAAVAFMLQNDTRDMFFSAGGTRPMHMLEPTPELLEMWEDCCDYYGYNRRPAKDDTMVQVESDVQFPGMKLTTVSASGLFVVQNRETGLQEYHTFFVGEQQVATGLAPSVWIFNKLTGNNKREQGKFHRGSGQAVSVISVTEDANAVAFSFDIKLEITVNFPKTLLKILPMSKKKMEEQAGSSMRKAVSKDVDSALDAVYNSFVKSTNSVETQ